MKRPTIIQGIIVAIVLSVIAVPTWFFGATMLSANNALRILIGVITLIYIGYLLSRCPVRTGRTTLGLGALALFATALWFSSSLLHYLLLAVSLIWIVRSLLAYRSVVAAIGDALLCVFAVGCAIVAFAFSRSVIISVWCFFLAQSLFVLIPQRIGGTKESSAEQSEFERKQQKSTERFSRAASAAEESLRQLIQDSA